MCVGRITHEFIPHHIKPRRVTASDLWLPIIHNFIPHHITSLPHSASDLWPNSFDSSNRECPCILKDDKSLLRFVKRSRSSNWTQVEKPESSINMRYRVQAQEENRGSLNAERLPGRTNNKKGIHWHNNNSENRSAGKRKMCDLNVHLDDNLECSWPLLTETLDEVDNDSTSDSGSDSEAYSGPS